MEGVETIKIGARNAGTVLRAKVFLKSSLFFNTQQAYLPGFVIHNMGTIKMEVWGYSRQINQQSHELSTHSLAVRED